MKKEKNKVTVAYAMIAIFISIFILNITIVLALSDTSNIISKDIATSIATEKESLRGEYVKHFLNEDGSYTAVVYNEPVHKKVNGAWKEIDNSILLKKQVDGTERYVNKDGLVEVSFAKNYEEKLVEMKDEDYSISWGIKINKDNQKTASKQVISKNSELKIASSDISDATTEEKKTLAKNISSKVQYKESLASAVDLEYVVLPTRVKESIILTSPQDIKSYVVSVETKGLKAKLKENKEIEFLDSNDNIIFTMWAPYMYDSATELSEDIDVSLKNIGGNKYEITMTPDELWLNDSARVYPITIDPDVSVSRVRSNIIDNYVWEGYGNQNENLDRMYIGKKSGKIARAYLKYKTMPTIPSGATITSATQRVNIFAGTTSAYNAAAYKVTAKDWDSATITWANKPEAATAINTNISHNNKSYYSFDCTSVVKSWYNGSTVGKNANYGIMMRYKDETVNDYNSFYSSDYATESKRPLLSISYKTATPTTTTTKKTTTTTTTTKPVTTSEIVWPVPNNSQINSKWGYRTYDSNIHYGIDISCKADDKKIVRAAISGTAKREKSASAGNTIIVTKTGSSFQTRYYHLESYHIQDNTVVKAGDDIGKCGKTGNADGIHLHFQLQWGANKNLSYNPLETYHQDDKRYNAKNPNPMFIYSNKEYVPNKSFDYNYKASYYNNIDLSNKRS